MEFRSENVEAQLSLSSRQTANQQTCIAAEDTAVTSEISIERSDVVEVEKSMVIQNKFIINEKYVVPKAAMTYPASHIWYGNHDLYTDSNASLVSCEGGFPNSQESGKMEVASQESLDSRMDISSQGSHLSLMEYSSQEGDVAIEPATDVCIPNSGRLNSPKAICHAHSSKEDYTIRHLPDVVPKEENYVKEAPNIEKPIFPHEYIPYNEDGFLNAEEDISKLNAQECGNYAAALENEMRAEEYYNRRLSTEKSLLSREEAVAAREGACMSREKAIEEREAALENQGTRSREETDHEVRSSKRLKLIGVFECN